MCSRLDGRGQAGRVGVDGYGGSPVVGPQLFAVVGLGRPVNGDGTATAPSSENGLVGLAT